jgi:hypothetical protein
VVDFCKLGNELPCLNEGKQFTDQLKTYYLLKKIFSSMQLLSRLQREATSENDWCKTLFFTKGRKNDTFR